MIFTRDTELQETLKPFGAEFLKLYHDHKTTTLVFTSKHFQLFRGKIPLGSCLQYTKLFDGCIKTDTGGESEWYVFEPDSLARSDAVFITTLDLYIESIELGTLNGVAYYAVPWDYKQEELTK